VLQPQCSRRLLKPLRGSDKPIRDWSLTLRSSSSSSRYDPNTDILSSILTEHFPEKWYWVFSSSPHAECSRSVPYITLQAPLGTNQNWNIRLDSSRTSSQKTSRRMHRQYVFRSSFSDLAVGSTSAVACPKAKLTACRLPQKFPLQHSQSRVPPIPRTRD